MSVFLAIIPVLCAGCSPDAASTNQRYTEDSFPQDRVLSEHDQSLVLQAMSSAATGTRSKPLVPATTGIRWADVPAALRTAASVCMLGVGELKPEADKIETADEITATLVEPDGERGQAVVVRTATEFTVRVSLGAFGQPKDEAAFVAAFEAELRRLGKLRRR